MALSIVLFKVYIMSKTKGIIVYRGPSMYNAKPIVAVLTRSNNRKTGNMVQLWILSDETNPIEASRGGYDASVCGKCPHMGKPAPDKINGWADGRTCYVNLIHGPSAVYKGLQRGIYSEANHVNVRGFLSGNMLRLGAYGDQAALPVALIDLLVSYSRGHTGYSHVHNMREHDASVYKTSMFSADNKRDAINAHSKGYRTFRVIPVDVWKEKQKGELLSNEIICPATPEGGNKSTCVNCGLCNGMHSNGAKNIAVVAHGSSRNKIREA
jgi:hypothetical protein